MSARLAACAAGQAEQIGLDRQRVGIGHVGVGRIGHRRIKPRAVAADAALHGVEKIPIAVVADAGLLVGRDIGRIERAERQRNGEAAGIGLAARAVWQTMQSAARARYSPRFTTSALASAPERRSDRRRCSPPARPSSRRRNASGPGLNAPRHKNRAGDPATIMMAMTARQFCA